MPKQKEKITVELADNITANAIKQLDAGIAFRQPRMAKIQLIEDMMAMKERPQLPGKFSIPFDGIVMRGYIFTLLSKFPKGADVNFGPPKASALKAAKKIKAAWDIETDPQHANLKLRKRWGDLLMCISGRQYYAVYGKRNPFKFCIENIDHYDFVGEPNGGADLDDHLFNFRLNIFRSQGEIEDQATKGYYRAGQVKKLINKYATKDFKEVDDEHKNKQGRFASIGLDGMSNNYVGGNLFNLTEGVTDYQGKKYYLLFDRRAKTWVRCEHLSDVFDSGLTPYVSAASDEDPFNHLSLGPADMIYPIAEGMFLNLNGMLNNMRKKNDDMIAYDSTLVTDPAQLVYRPEGLVAMAMKGHDIRSAIMQLQPQDVAQLSTNINTFLNNFLGENSGITKGAKGVDTSDVATVYLGNIQEVADRIALYNDSPITMLEKIARRFDWALYEHADESYLARVIGEKAGEWERITTEEKEPEYIATAIVGQEKTSLLKAREQKAVLESIAGNQVLVKGVNPKAIIRELLSGAQMEEERIKTLLDTNTETNQIILSEAARLIENCLQGKYLDLYQGADTAFLQYIQDYALTNRLDQKEFYKLMALVEAHKDIVVRNMTRKAMDQRRMMAAAAAALGIDKPVKEEPPTEPVAEVPVETVDQTI